MWILAVLVIAGGCSAASSGKGSPSPGSSNASTAGMTVKQRATNRCVIVVASGVGLIQSQGSSASEAMAKRLGSNSWIYATIARANNYLTAAKQRDPSAALQRTRDDIEYLCQRRLANFGLVRGTSSTATTVAQKREQSHLRSVLLTLAAAVVVTGVTITAYRYFRTTGAFAGVSQVSDVSGFTGLTGFSGVTGTSGDTVSGFTGITGTSGVTGTSGGGTTGFTGGGATGLTGGGASGFTGNSGGAAGTS
jgi:hypothetical protein